MMPPTVLICCCFLGGLNEGRGNSLMGALCCWRGMGVRISLIFCWRSVVVALDDFDGTAALGRETGCSIASMKRFLSIFFVPAVEVALSKGSSAPWPLSTTEFSRFLWIAEADVRLTLATLLFSEIGPVKLSCWVAGAGLVFADCTESEKFWLSAGPVLILPLKGPATQLWPRLKQWSHALLWSLPS